MFYVIYTQSFGNSGGMINFVLEFISKEAATPSISVAVPLWFWEFSGNDGIFLISFFNF